MRQTTLFAALSVLAVAAAQNLTINPSEVDLTTRTQWCNAEFNTCGILCGGNPTANTCTSADLTFTCTCSNGSAPGLQYYTQTMPTFICQQAFSDCIQKNIGDSIGQGACKTNIQAKCGTLDPSKVQVGGGQTTSSSAPTGTAATTSSSSPTPTKASAAIPKMAPHLGSGFAVLAAVVFAAALL